MGIFKIVLIALALACASMGVMAGSITGKVSAAGTGQPISTGTVRIHNASGATLGSAFPDGAGNYTYSGLAAGIYFARTNSTGFFDELWNDIPCAQGACVVTTGTPITVASSPVVANFVLASGGSITGKISSAATGQPISTGTVRIHNASGATLGSAFPDGAGNYTYSGLAAGTYFARTNSTGFFDELWNDMPCAQGACVVTTGTPIYVSSSAGTIVNFQLSGNVDLIFSNGFETSAPTQLEALESPDDFWDEIELGASKQWTQRNVEIE